MGDLVISAVKEFFESCQLLKQLKTTTLALIPKVPHPTMISEFRPIFCCNILYKSIAKILANRLKICLPSLISWNQSAFIKRRRLIDNILLAHEVVRDYHKSSGKPRCTLKIDLKNAFDSIN